MGESGREMMEITQFGKLEHAESEWENERYESDSDGRWFIVLFLPRNELPVITGDEKVEQEAQYVEGNVDQHHNAGCEF